jgi:hypothetical protein
MTFLLAIWRSSAGHRRRHLVEPVRYAWDWRRGVRVVEQDNASDYAEGCDIKGNINRDGEMIYHVPDGCCHANSGSMAWSARRTSAMYPSA